VRIRKSVKIRFLETIWPTPRAGRRDRDSQMFVFFLWRLHLSINSMVAHPDCSSSRDTNHEIQPPKVVCFSSPGSGAGDRSLTGSEGGVKFDFLCILPRNLSSNRGKHRADFKERGASSLGSSLKQRGLSGTWSKLNTNNQTQNSVKRWILS